jgi:methylenetetrahydrofolate reductase (NADPH)
MQQQRRITVERGIRKAAERHATMMSYSLEVTPRNGEAFEAAARLLPPLTEVFVADLPNQVPDLLIEACARYRRAGLRPVPHLVARNIDGLDKLRFLLSRLVGDAEVERALVLGGDRSEPAGPFNEALDLLATGQLPEHGIRQIALACFPEGHPTIPDDELQRALEAKLAAAAQGDLDVLLVSQFLFDTRPLLDYTRRLRAGGIDAPLRAGLAGPADAETLLQFAEELGVGGSKRVMQSKAAKPDERKTDQSPQRLTTALVKAQASEPSLRIEGFHFFAFGSTKGTIAWANRHRP